MINTKDADLLKNQIFSIQTDLDFEKMALLIFQYQASANSVYKKYIDLLNIDPVKVNKISSIPFLPIDFFKEEKILTGQTDYDVVFTSSGTTGPMTSSHYVADQSLYEKSFLKGFEYFYRAPADYAILALLPSYLEQKNSSLIYMMNRLIRETHHTDSGFYLYNDDELINKIKKLKEKKTKFILWGVTFALLELAEKFEFDFGNNIILETGGMKGRRKEIVREELHRILCERFHLSSVHSEYGMTELLSQAYSKGNGIFQTPPWMKILIRDLNDPFVWSEENRTGGINVIDLANINSCSFIATQDLGRRNREGTFEVLGRFDNSELRGCNLLIQ